jgi:hypothetical protein
MQNTCYKNLAALREKKKTHTRIHEVLSDGKNKRPMAMRIPVARNIRLVISMNNESAYYVFRIRSSS